ncbi:hypothetical protein VB735_07690 [Halotia wernerae UHCC 0503]|nr:hypothetical protein [Halotia wernerae UHCC 0503]
MYLWAGDRLIERRKILHHNIKIKLTNLSIGHNLVQHGVNKATI